MLEGMAPGPVTVRTFDVDEDQLARPLADGWVADAERAWAGAVEHYFAKQVA